MTNRHRSRIRTGASGAARDSSTRCAGQGCGRRYRIRYRTAFCSGCLGCPLPAVVLASLAELTSRPPHRTAGGGVVKSAPVPGNQVRERAAQAATAKSEKQNNPNFKNKTTTTATPATADATGGWRQGGVRLSRSRRAWCTGRRKTWSTAVEATVGWHTGWVWSSCSGAVL